MIDKKLELEKLKLKSTGPQYPGSYKRAQARYQRMNKEGKLAKPKYTHRTSIYYG